MSSVIPSPGEAGCIRRTPSRTASRRVCDIYGRAPIRRSSTGAARGGTRSSRERSLRENFDKLDPNLLIIGFVLNDAEPSGVAEVEALRHDLSRRDPRRGGMKFLFDRSRLFALIWNRIENTRQRRALTTYYLELYEGDDWRHCQGALRRMRNLARDRDVPMLLVILPIFDSPLDDRYPYQDLHRLVTKTAERLKIPVLDLWPTFRDLETRRLAVAPFTDAHPNELANRIITDAIVRYLRRKDLVRIPRQRR